MGTKIEIELDDNIYKTLEGMCATEGLTLKRFLENWLTNWVIEIAINPISADLMDQILVNAFGYEKLQKMLKG